PPPHPVRRLLLRPAPTRNSAASAFLGRWNFLAGLARLRQSNRDRLLRIRHLLAAAAALQLALLHRLHLAFDILTGRRAVLTSGRFLRGFLCCALLCS